MLLANSGVDSGHRISVLAAASPNNSNLSENATTKDFLTAISYTSVSSILRQCDRVKSNETQDNEGVLQASAINSSELSGNPQTKARHKRTLSPEQLADLKSRSTCRKCKQVGHWESDHNSGGSLNANVKSISTEQFKNDTQKKSVTFNMVNFRSIEAKNNMPNDFVGPLLDDSGMGQCELKILQSFLLLNWNGKLDPLRTEILDCPFWQYGTGQHASEPRRILSSVVIKATSDQGSPVHIRHSKGTCLACQKKQFR